MKKIFILSFLFFILNFIFINKALNIDDYIFVGKAAQKALSYKLSTLITISPNEKTKDAYYLGYKTEPYNSSKPPLQYFFFYSLYSYFNIHQEQYYHLFIWIINVIFFISFYYLSTLLIPFNLAFFCSLLLFNSACLVSSNSIMADIPMASFFLLSLALFIYGLRNNSKLMIIFSGFAAFISYMISYQALFLIVLLSVLLIFNNNLRSKCHWFPILFIAITLIIWSVINVYFVGYPHILYAFRTSDNIASFNLIKFIVKAISDISAIGGATVFAPFLFIGFFEKRLDFIKLGFLLIFAFFSIFFFASDYSHFYKLLFIIFFLTGAFTTLKIFEILIKSKNKMDIFLSTWYILFLICIILFLPFGCVRYTIPLIPPLIILFIKTSKNNFKTEKAFKIFCSLGIIFTLLLGTLVAYADFEYAGVYRTFARSLESKYKSKTNNIWFTGEWGFRYYMEDKGYKYLIPVDNSPKEGDIVVIPTLPCPIALHSDLQARLKIIDTTIFHSNFPIRVMNREAHAGFYSDGWGLLPYSFSTVPLETFKIYQVER